MNILNVDVKGKHKNKTQPKIACRETPFELFFKILDSQVGTHGGDTLGKPT